MTGKGLFHVGKCRNDLKCIESKIRSEKVAPTSIRGPGCKNKKEGHCGPKCEYLKRKRLH
ncbi:MAG: hypothetical protein A2020_03170 [Lentisphaerae bacterium GWF2_45_14]|nr:MAG: hypothetical protein A2020_03170 [Lentisphaerae bacterium GWF2_45_14]